VIEAVAPGQTIEVEVDGIGVLEQRVERVSR
jgi:2-keto-4-pentenoate hydratase/2-oxohepta-3-ene-1,7-dioic acid hydratase in catechol pathway